MGYERNVHFYFLFRKADGACNYTFLKLINKFQINLGWIKEVFVNSGGSLLWS